MCACSNGCLDPHRVPKVTSQCPYESRLKNQITRSTPGQTTYVCDHNFTGKKFRIDSPYTTDCTAFYILRARDRRRFSSDLGIRVHYLTRNSHFMRIKYTIAYLWTRSPQGRHAVTVRLPKGVLPAVIHMKLVAVICAFRPMLRAIRGTRMTVIIIDKTCGAVCKPRARTS